MSQMSSSNKGPIDPDVLDLMIQQATCGLNEQERRELEALGLDDEQARIDLTAAAFDLAMLGHDNGPGTSNDDELPANLRQQITTNAQEFFSSQAESKNREGSARAIDRAVHAETETQAVPPVSRATPSGSKDLVTRREVIAMSIAAASLLLVFTGLNPLAFNPNKDPAPVASVEVSPSEQLVAFLDDKPSDLIDLPWKGVMDEGVEGRVVWSDEAQRGFMVLKGLAVNDPKVEQYQLWIFDTDPGQEIPVDGGVFDVSKAEQDANTGEVIIPFKPHVPVAKGVMFAITIEQPGGVMRSDRSRLPVLASLN